MPATTLTASDIMSSLVMDHGMVTGIVTKSDLMKSAPVSGLRGTVRDVMEDAVTVNHWHSLVHVVTVAPVSTLQYAVAWCTANRSITLLSLNTTPLWGFKT